MQQILCFIVAAALGAPAPKENFDAFGLNVALPDAVAALLDPNSDGQIDDDEAARAEESFVKLSKTRQPIGQEIRKALDADGNRKVDAEEARQGVARGKANHTGVATEVADLVKRLDANGDEKISPQEFRGLLGQFGPLAAFIAPKLNQFFNQMDADRNGELSLVEAQRGEDHLREQFKQVEDQNRRQALARDPHYQQAQRTLSQLDKNKDRLISKAEARKNKQVLDVFLDADTSLDDHLSLEECRAYLEKQSDPNQRAQPKVEFLPQGELNGPKKRK